MTGVYDLRPAPPNVMAQTSSTAHRGDPWLPTLTSMPVIVIGADTPTGHAVVDALLPRRGEVRAFVSDPTEAAALKERGVKVAVGDVSDGSHIGGAATQGFLRRRRRHCRHG